MANLSDRIRSKLEGTGGLVPVGAIIAYSPGYYTAAANGGSFNVVGPSANTVAQINAHLPPEWRVCNGDALNDAESPIFNATGRYLPDITGQRFLRGHTAVGAVGGNTGNQLTLNAPQLPTHGHPAGTLAADNANAPHGHTVTVAGDNAPHSHGNIRVANSAETYRNLQTFDAGGDNLNNAAISSIVLDFDGRGRGSSSNYLAHTSTDNAPHNHPGSSANSNNAPHTHSVSGSTGDVGSGSAVDITPQYINTVYIMRVK